MHNFKKILITLGTASLIVTSTFVGITNNTSLSNLKSDSIAKSNNIISLNNNYRATSVSGVLGKYLVDQHGGIFAITKDDFAYYNNVQIKITQNGSLLPLRSVADIFVTTIDNLTSYYAIAFDRLSGYSLYSISINNTSSNYEANLIQKFSYETNKPTNFTITALTKTTILFTASDNISDTKNTLWYIDLKDSTKTKEVKLPEVAAPITNNYYVSNNNFLMISQVSSTSEKIYKLTFDAEKLNFAVTEISSGKPEIANIYHFSNMVLVNNTWEFIAENQTPTDPTLNIFTLNKDLTQYSLKSAINVPITASISADSALTANGDIYILDKNNSESSHIYEYSHGKDTSSLANLKEITNGLPENANSFGLISLGGNNQMHLAMKSNIVPEFEIYNISEDISISNTALIVLGVILGVLMLSGVAYILADKYYFAKKRKNDTNNEIIQKDSDIFDEDGYNIHGINKDGFTKHGVDIKELAIPNKPSKKAKSVKVENLKKADSAPKMNSGSKKAAPNKEIVKKVSKDLTESKSK